MDIIPKIVAGIFLFRTLKNPLHRIIENVESSPLALLVLSFFLLGEFGFIGIVKLLPMFIYIHLQYHPFPSELRNWRQYDGLEYVFYDLKDYFCRVKDIGQFTLYLTPIISSTALLTGWFVRNPRIINSLPVNVLLGQSLISPIWTVVICVGIGYSLKYTNKIMILTLFMYLSLFFSSDHLSFLFLFVFVLIGLLTKHDQDNNPFLSLHMIETCLTVGTLFTTSPANIIFAIGSIVLVWKLSKLNDQLKMRIPFGFIHNHELPTVVSVQRSKYS